MNLFINTQLNEPHVQQLRQALGTDHPLVFRHDLAPADQEASFQQAEAILGNPPAAWWATPPPNLQYWQLDSAGFDGYRDVRTDALVANMGDWFAWPCAETIVAGILALYRGIDQLAVLQQEKKWIGAPMRGRLDLLRHKRVVILGAGAIGQAVQKMLTGFDCDVLLMARTNPDAQLHTAEELAAALPTIDLVVNCLPGSAKDFFTAELLAAMKKGSVFANIGRGTTVDEPALIAALQSGHLGGAVLDVNQTEPLPADNPLWSQPNVILTQHTGGGQLREDDGKVDVFLQNLALFLAGQPLKNRIDLSKGY